MAPRQTARGRAHPPQHTLRPEATDTGASRTHGPKTPVATLSVPTERLSLLLWGRTSSTSEAFCWTGDRRAGRTSLGSYGAAPSGRSRRADRPRCHGADVWPSGDRLAISTPGALGRATGFAETQARTIRFVKRR
ncbi:hypothetical protein ABZ656_10890 [Streptomyces sp. NPDC007095]|uniref:hypothetical protein n=1 Tax=Streptomyces sp. NPDC007095 TaxID=3154482 RepID=UPI0033CE271A